MEKAAKYILVFTCLYAFLFWGSNKAYSQTNPLEKKISLTVNNESVESTLIKMEKLGGYSFSYNSDIVPVDSLVSVNAVNKETGKILGNMLGEQFYYKTSGHFIILLKKTESKPKNQANNTKTKYIITGTVVDSRTGETISTATVYNINKIETAMTDSTGKFALKTNADSDVLTIGISKVDYYDTIIYIRPSELNKLELKLTPKPETFTKLQPKTTNTINTKKVDEGLLVKTVVGQELLTNSSNLSSYETRKWQVSFLPFAGTNHKLSGSIVNKFSFNILSGYSSGVDGVELGGLLNINKKDVKGFQLGGLGNITGGNVEGVQVGGFFNNTLGKVKGMQIAGFCNIVFDTLQGAQLAGYVNIQRNKLEGYQLSGFTNITTGDMEKMQATGYVNIALGNNNGVQASGFSNISKGDNNGFQISGYSNISGGKNNKLQLSSFANIAVKESKGTQVSGFLNYSKDVKGYQIGIINIADTVSGLSLGIFNIVRKGYHSINVSMDEMLFTNLAYHMGTYKLYTIFGLSGNALSENNIWGATFGFGTLIRPEKKFSINIDLTATQINRDSIWLSKITMKNKLNIGLNYNVFRHWSINAGPSLNLYISDNKYSGLRDYITDVSPHNFYNKTYSGNNYQAWIGCYLGVTFRL
jgi:hypothetical protein